MGIRAYYNQISPELLEKIKNDPSILEIQTSPELLEKIKNDPSILNEVSVLQNTLELEKSWGGIQFLLTGSTEEDGSPLSKAVIGRKLLEDEVIDKDAAAMYLEDTFYSTAEEVKEAAKALSEISREELAQRFDLDAIETAQIYPGYRDKSGDFKYSLSLEDLLAYYEYLVNYYVEAADKSAAMLIVIG